MNTLNIIPSRIKYYLTEWKNDNPDHYTLMYGDSRLNELCKEQLYELFFYVSKHDLELVLNTNKVYKQ